MNHTLLSGSPPLGLAGGTPAPDNTPDRLLATIEELTALDAGASNLKRENANINGDSSMGTMLQYGSAVAKELCRRRLLHPDHAAAHDRGDIHIHDLDFLPMGTLTCCQIDLTALFRGGFDTGHGHLREPQDIMSYTALTAIAIQSNQNDQHGGQSVPTFDYALAPGVAKTFRSRYRDHYANSLQFVGGRHTDRAKVLLALCPLLAEVGADHMGRTDPEAAAERQAVAAEFGLSSDEVAWLQDFAYLRAEAETEQRTYQAMEALIHNLNTMHSRAGAQVPFSSLNFGTDTSPEGRTVTRNLLRAQERGLGNGETPIFPILIFKVKEGVNYESSDPNYDLFRQAIKVSATRLFPNFSFLDAPFNACHYQHGHPETEAVYMGCRTRVVGNACGTEQVLGRGNLSFTTLNLPRLGIEHGITGAADVPARSTADLDGFFAALDRRVDLVCAQLLERLSLQSGRRVRNFPFLMGEGVWRGSERLQPNDEVGPLLAEGTLSMGFIGLAECLVALTGRHHAEDEEARALGLRIISHLRDRMDEATRFHGLNFSLLATPAEGLAGRFTAMDHARYGALDRVTDREYYTNSFHVPVWHKVTAYQKLMIEAPFHELTNAGHISYVELDGSPLHNLDAFEAIVRAMHDAGIGYGSVNHPLDRDPVCGYSGVIDDVCPRCGREEGSNGIRFERIRRITGYLAGTLDRFNDAKRAEVGDRVRHC